MATTYGPEARSKEVTEMSESYVYEITLTRDEQDTLQGELIGIIERNEPHAVEWNPTEWKALNSAYKKIADARPVIRSSSKRKGRSSPSGMQGIRR
jgi:hypothetical protein